ncbi:MAG TPA: RnfABCDGE type electron transport complex subunit D [Clostridiales bacterium]|jgi:electron transport complex protein RnfD|nr:RnfABCDGE type electron transport complex subunit D [Clostridiales bacterium]
MVLDKKLTVSASPHVRSGATTTGIMLDVIIAMIPALIAAVVFFGPRVLALTAVTVITSVVSEFLSRKAMKRHNTLGDLSAVVTGMLLAFNLPASMPFWMAAIGAVVAIVVVKQFFGGIGMNYVNPALIGRIVLFVSFPAAMTNWVAAGAWKDHTVEAITTATPLAQLKTVFATGNFEGISEAMGVNLTEMFFGKHGSSLGEACAAALIIGGIYLLIRGVIAPTIPVTYLGTVALITLIAGKGSLTFVAYQLLSGGLLLGAIFMATDYTTSPVNFKGQIIFGIGCGLLTAIIRLYGNIPEGVSFAIIIMNILVPHIERITTGKPFGTPKKVKDGGEVVK